MLASQFQLKLCPLSTIPGIVVQHITDLVLEALPMTLYYALAVWMWPSVEAWWKPWDERTLFATALYLSRAIPFVGTLCVLTCK